MLCVFWILMMPCFFNYFSLSQLYFWLRRLGQKLGVFIFYRADFFLFLTNWAFSLLFSLFGLLNGPLFFVFCFLLNGFSIHFFLLETIWAFFYCLSSFLFFFYAMKFVYFEQKKLFIYENNLNFYLFIKKFWTNTTFIASHHYKGCYLQPWVRVTISGPYTNGLENSTCQK